MDEIKNSTGILSTFYDMLTNKERFAEYPIEAIVIPKIQRDYAQGRKSAGRIRKNFLNALFEAIDNRDSSPLELDFVYGDYKNNTKIFYPLDGQQRLTTLFLLYWYVAKRLNQKNIDFLRKFSYETRESSKEFCVKLFNINPNFKQPVDDFIKDCNWYTKTWASDPTIASMLVMIRDIESHYNKFSNIQMQDVWDNLIGNEELGKIRFYLLFINDLETTDDLYVKMNSRGKPLTDFEHFKAELGKYTKNQKDFILNVDTIWTTLLWSYRNSELDKDPKKYEDNGLDKSFLNFFRAYLTITGVKEGLFNDEDTKNINDFDILEKVLGTDKCDIYLDRLALILNFFYSQFQRLGSLKAFFEEFLTGKPCDEQKVFINESQQTRIDLVFNACNLIHNRPNLLLLEAFFEAAIKYQDRNITEWSETFLDRVRIVRNLLVNSSDAIRKDTMKDLLLRIDKIISDGDLDVNATDFTKLQKQQEIQKLDWMTKYPEYRSIMIIAENHQMLYGNLKPLETATGFDVVLLKRFVKVFNSKDRLSLVEQGMLSIGDYGYYLNSRCNYGGVNFDCNGEWRNNVFVNQNNVTPAILQEFLYKLTDESTDNDIQEIVNSYEKECEENNKYPWHYYLVKHAGMRHGRSGKYYWDKESGLYDRVMMKETNFNGYHWNPFLFCLSKKIKGSTIGNYNHALVLPNGICELLCHNSYYELKIANEPTLIIKIPQIDGIDTVDRINFITPQEGVDLMEHLRSLADKSNSILSEFSYKIISE